jgi:hypothetical protein
MFNMSLPTNREEPFASGTLTRLFIELSGYYDLGNEELAGILLRWNLLEERNRTDINLAYDFVKWSLTVSFLELVNSLQWFLAGVLLHRLARFPAQVMQLYYYSIFFSYGSFLAAHGKGYYTVKQELDGSKSTRKEVWFFEEDKHPQIWIEDKGRGGEHEIRAKWFYKVFNNWDQRASHPAVIMFERDSLYHSGFRNMFTYSLFTMANELHSDETLTLNLPTNEILLSLWNRDEKLVDYFPEEFWVLEHIKVSVHLHSMLLEKYKHGTPYAPPSNIYC